MYIKINNKNYAGLTTSLKRKATIIYSENSGDTLANTTTLDAKGTRIDYTITVDSMYKDQQLLEDFWNDIIKPRNEGFMVEFPYNQTTLRFRAFAETASQNYVQEHNGNNIWDSISVDIKTKQLQFEDVV